MHSVRALTVIQLICLIVWVGSMVSFFVTSASDPARWIWGGLWAVTMAMFFIVFWRAMWLASDSRRKQKSEAS